MPLLISQTVCWDEIKGFCGSNHIWEYNEVEAYQNREVCLCLNIDCLYLNCCWHEFWSFCVCLKLISSAYLKNCCGQKLDDLDFQRLCGRSHLWIYDKVNIDNVRYQNNKICFVRVLISYLDLINSLWLMFRANKPIIMLVLDAWWCNQNGSILFEKILMT